MKVTYDVSVKCSDARIAKTLELVLHPDNRAFPKDQRFESRRRGNTLHLRVDSPRVMPALSSLESLLADASLFEEVWLLTI